MNKYLKQEIESLFPIPAHIDACAYAIRYDLYHGPSYSLIPEGKIENFNKDCLATYPEDLKESASPEDIIEETYCGLVGDSLREFMENLPTRLYCFEDCILGENEPNSDWIEDESDWQDWFCIDQKQIFAALFGDFLAKEFN